MKSICVFIYVSFLLVLMPLIAASGPNTGDKIDLIIRIGKKHFPTVTWDKKSIVHADINCDGKTDYAVLGYEKDVLHVMLVLGDLSETANVETVAIGLGDSSSQDHLCGTKAELQLESQESDLTEELGENPEGFRKSKICKGLNVSDGMCDSFHLYWNHKTKSLDAWRL